MVNGTSVTLRPIAGSGACGSGRIIGAETHVNSVLVEVGVFAESDGGRFCEEVLN